MKTLRQVLLLCRLLLSCAWGASEARAAASLYRGGEALGSVATTAGPTSDIWVSLEDVGALLGFSSSRKGEELQLTQGGVRLRVVMNAAAAWRDIYLVPLSASPFEKDGRCWLDAASVVSLFQKSVGYGGNNRLRFHMEASAAMEPEPVAMESPTPALELEPAASPAPAAPAAVSEPAAAKPAKVSAQPAKQQEKYETFRPEVAPKKPSHPSLNGGEIQCLRWSATNRRIRAVVDASDGADPQVQMKDGVIHALFASAAASPEGLPSPYLNVKAELRQTQGGAELVFTSDSLRVEKMVLDGPRRIVFDFFFDQGVHIREIPAPKPQPVLTAETPPARASTPVPTPMPQGGRGGKGKKLVVVDPGHGGKDPGASANGVREKDINLAVGLFLERALQEKGFEVLMTRRTDVYLKLQERTDIANKADADVFVSVHVNALPSAKRASGFEIYLMALPTDKDALQLAKIENRELAEGKSAGSQASDERTERLLRILGDMQQNNKINESTGLAEALFSAGKQNGIPMKRVAQAPFFVLRGAGMPAVLLETGFLTNATEAKLLAHSGYQQRLAQAMAAGVASYLK